MSDDLAVLSAELAKLSALVGRLCTELAAWRMAPCAGAPGEQLLTLDQLAAIVGRRKRSLEDYRKLMPPPRVKGTRGRPSLWAWADVREWLSSRFGRALPERFPDWREGETP